MMQLRRPARLLAAAGVLLVAAPALASCGFDYATDRVYTPGAGTNDRDGQVDVLGAVVVSAEDGSGTLVASFSNNNDDEPTTVEAIEGTFVGEDGTEEAVEVGEFEPIEIPAGGLVNLANAEEPIAITGGFETGDFLTLHFTFGNGESAELDVPTVVDCYEYAGLDETAEAATPHGECEPEETTTEH